MLIKNDFEVAAPVEKVWQFFDDIPQVAACLPGTELTEGPRRRQVRGPGGGPDGPGPAPVRRHGRDHRAGRGRQAGRDPRERRRAAGPGPGQHGRHRGCWPGLSRGTKVGVTQDLQLAGAAAQYGRGMISDVTAVLMRDFSANMAARIDGRRARRDARAGGRRLPGGRIHAGDAGRDDGAPAGLRPLLPALPAQPDLRESEPWSCGGSATRSCWWSSCPSSSALLNRVLAALERIRGATDDILSGWRRPRRRARRRPEGAGHDRRHGQRSGQRRGPVRGLGR